MRIRMTGHAGLFIRTRGGATILGDPWFTPAYFGSWLPFPDNAGVDLTEISSPDYLYVSHLHKDHFDPVFLAAHVDKGATVLLPDFPMADLREALEALGFHRFISTTSGRPVRLHDGSRVVIATSVSVSDGPIGDSALAVDDGVNRILDQNDCHPRELKTLGVLGPYDIHFLQYSGAIWYPMVYRMDPEDKARLCREKRERQVTRAMRYIETIGAPHIVPFAGPPAFLDDDLFELNDFDDDPSNIFLDQESFLRMLSARGVDAPAGHLAVPGTEIEIDGDRFEVRHTMPDDERRAAYEDKRTYLLAYKARRQAEIEALKPSPASVLDPEALVQAMKEWIEPLLAAAPSVRDALGGPIVLDAGRYGVVIDPGAGAVRRWADEEPDHFFAIDEALLSSLVERRVEDWVNELFLSCRFEAWRSGPYNETVFSFFKCLSPGRMAYFEASKVLAQRALVQQAAGAAPAEGELWRCGAYLVQRRCPHLGADLSRFSDVEDGVLTCALHGRRFDLETGRCLDADCPPLFTFPVPEAEPELAER